MLMIFKVCKFGVVTIGFCMCFALRRDQRLGGQEFRRKLSTRLVGESTLSVVENVSVLQETSSSKDLVFNFERFVGVLTSSRVDGRCKAEH